MLHLHRAERADQLVKALAGIVVDPLADPLAPAVVAVPTRGIERWLSQRLAGALGARSGRRDGVCANVDFPFPGALVGAAVAAATGVDRDTDPWLPERAVWPLLAVVEAHLDEGWLSGLAAHLGAAPVAPGVTAGATSGAAARADRRFGALRHLADLYDRYAVHRPAMLRAWAEGRDSAGDGTPLAPDTIWQARLWRLLHEHLQTPSPAERLPGACAALRDTPGLADLPGTLSLFGLTRLPASYLDVLRALAARREVHLLLLHPSPALWTQIRASGQARGLVRRNEDLTPGLAANPLLGTWGRDAREMQLVLAGGQDPAADHHHPVEAPSSTLLARLQADVRADRAPPGLPPPGAPEGRAALDAADRSLQVHACHGRARQVEVLRDAVLHLLADDPTLEPRDVLVMCPDIETFAPLIHATFGGAALGEGHGALPDLRVRLADRSLRQTNPVLGAVAALLELATSRATASQVLDFAGREPVRRRFGLDDGDLTRVEEWVTATGIRWGFDAAGRAPYQVGLSEGTWAAGLDRVLVGVVMAEEQQRLVAGVLPLDDVDSGDIELAGRLGELLDRLTAACGALAAAQPVQAWADALTAAADALTATAPADAWQRAQLQRILDDVVAESAAGAGPGARADAPASSPALLSPAELRDVLADRLRGRPTRASFRTGHLTVCTLVPMRSVPHRVVCLLGLDDGVFPRRVTPDGDDLLARDPHVGDRDPRSEDRQLLLDALLAAEQHLVITYAGRDERTNAVLPPAVPVGELLDAVEATVVPAAGRGSAREQVVTAHPLQPFDVRNFDPGALVDGTPWSFDRTALRGGQALAGERHDPPPFLDGRLPAPRTDLVEVDDLVRFVQHPVKAFLRQRLGIVLPGAGEEPGDALPVELDKLEEWGLGQRLLEARLAGADAESARAAELARGTLPPGGLALPVVAAVEATVERIVAVVGEELGGAGPGGGAAVDVHVPLPDGRTLVGTVLDADEGLVRAATYSRLAPKHRLAAWVRLLALTAAAPEVAYRSATVGRGRAGRVAIAAVAPLGDTPGERRAVALTALGVLLDLHDRGLREPLPLYCKTSAAYAEAVARGRSPQAAVRAAWESGWRGGVHIPGEEADAEHRLVLGAGATVRDIAAKPPADDECGPGWGEAERSRFGRYARRLWGELLAREEVGER